MISYQFDKAEGILYMKVSGVIALEEMMSRTERYRTYLSFTSNLKILEDAREALPGFDRAGLALLMEKLKTIIEEFDSIRHAVLHVDPTATAYALLNNRNTYSEKYEMKVFTSEKIAKEWLDEF